MASFEARQAAIRKAARIVRGEATAKALADRDERTRREERKRIIEWLRSDEAARITVGAGGPWFIATRLAEWLEEG